jgi:hypothetical protein
LYGCVRKCPLVGVRWSCADEVWDVCLGEEGRWEEGIHKKAKVVSTDRTLQGGDALATRAV